MAGTPVARAQAAVTADTVNNVVTVASTTAFVKGAMAYMSATGQANVEVKILAILNATTLQVRPTRAKGVGIPWSDTFAGTAQPVGTQAPNYGIGPAIVGFTLANAAAILQPAQMLFGDGMSTDNAAPSY